METKNRINVMIDGRMETRNVQWSIGSACVKNEFHFNPKIFLIDGVDHLEDYKQSCKFLTFSEEGFSLTIASIMVDTKLKRIKTAYAINARLAED